MMADGWHDYLFTGHTSPIYYEDEATVDLTQAEDAETVVTLDSAGMEFLSTDPSSHLQKQEKEDAQMPTESDEESFSMSSSWLDTVPDIGDAHWDEVPTDPKYWDQQAGIFSGYFSSGPIENAIKQALRLPSDILGLLCNRTFECLKRADAQKRRQWLMLMNLSGLEVRLRCKNSHIDNIDQIRRLIFLIVENALNDVSFSFFESIKTLRTATLVYNLVGSEPLADISASRLRQAIKAIAIRALDIPVGDRGITALGKLSYISLYGQSVSQPSVALNQNYWKNMINDEMELEFERFVECNSEAPHETKRRDAFALDIERLVEVALSVQCHPYGSRVTGLTLRDSDLDLGVSCREFVEKHGDMTAPGTSSPWRDLGERALASKLVHHAHHSIRSNSDFKQSGYAVELRASARKPLIRFIDCTSSPPLSADVVFASDLAGRRNSALLAHYARLDPRVKPLVIFVKYWSKQRTINGTFIGFLSSFGHTLTVIDFLQRLQPPVLPNIQMPDFEGSSIADEKLSQDPDRLADRGMPWYGWQSENEMTLGQLLRAYFAYMALECPWVANVISPRTAPAVMSKTSLFVENSDLNRPRPSSHAQRKASTGQGTTQSATLDIESVPTPQTAYEWIYRHPEHSVSSCIREQSSKLNTTLHRICVEDPSEKDRLLYPYRQYAQDQTTFEHIRAFVLLEAGLSLSVLCQRLVPLSRDPHGSSFLDKDALRRTKWWQSFGHQVTNEDDIVAKVRADCATPAVQKLKASDLLAPPDISLFPRDDDTSLILHWRSQRICHRLAVLLCQAENEYILQMLVRANG